MKLKTLSSERLISLQTQFPNRDEAISYLINLLDQDGKLSDKTTFFNDVLDRETQGPKALGEGLAVPHAKSSAVKEASFAIATLKKDLKWLGIDGDEDVNLIILLAIPEDEASSTHIQLLTKLTSTLIDEKTREAILNANSKQDVLDGLSPTDISEKVQYEEKACCK